VGSILNRLGLVKAEGCPDFGGALRANLHYQVG